jgi:hypothetical protein
VERSTTLNGGLPASGDASRPWYCGVGRGRVSPLQDYETGEDWTEYDARYTPLPGCCRSGVGRAASDKCVSNRSIVTRAHALRHLAVLVHRSVGLRVTLRRVGLCLGVPLDAGRTGITHRPTLFK